MSADEWFRADSPIERSRLPPQHDVDGGQHHQDQRDYRRQVRPEGIDKPLPDEVELADERREPRIEVQGAIDDLNPLIEPAPAARLVDGRTPA
jgi:hypothetical protein